MAVRYAHTLLFVCPDCNRSVSVTRVNDDKNLQALEEYQFQLTCVTCQKDFERLGRSAAAHSVQKRKAAAAE